MRDFRLTFSHTNSKHPFPTNAFPAFRAQTVSNLYHFEAFRGLCLEAITGWCLSGPQCARTISSLHFPGARASKPCHSRNFFSAFWGSYFESISGSDIWPCGARSLKLCRAHLGLLGLVLWSHFRFMNLGLLGLVLRSHYRLMFFPAFGGSCFEAISGS